MPGHPFWTNFSSGEITEKLDARVDLQKYQNGAHCILNMAVQVHGGVARRAGTTFVAEAKTSGAFDESAFEVEFETDPGGTVLRLWPFQFSTEQAYMLEFGAFYIRVYANRAYLNVEVATPYAAEHVRQLRFAQSADVLYIAHQRYAPRKFIRLAATTFQLQTIDFLPPPTTEPELTSPIHTLFFTATTGVVVVVTSDNPLWYPGDVGRRLRAGTGLAAITAWNTQQSVTVNILSPFSGLVFAPGQWTMDGSSNNVELTTIGAAEPQYGPTFFGANGDCFRIEDVGKYLYVNQGIIRIETIVPPRTGTGIILKPLTNTNPAPPGTWTVEAATWSETRGFPGVVNLFDQRLRFGGSPLGPDRIWASRVGDYENFARGALDDDAFQFVIASDDVNLIRWMKGLRKALIGTVGGEYDATGPNDGPVSAAAPPAMAEVSRWGADFDVDAIRAWNVILMLQRGAHKIRELAFDNLEENFQSPDLTILAEHLTREPILEMAYLPQPDSTVLCVRADGALLSMTYERPENVLAWAHHHTDGRYLSVAVIPNMCGTGNEVWVAVERQLPLPAGTGYETHRYLEVFDGGLNTDSALAVKGDAAAVFVGLDHLEGKTVSIITRDQPFDADVFDPDIIQEETLSEAQAVVTGGQVTLAQPAGQIEVGLPFQCELALLRPEIATQQGSLQGRRQRYNEVTVRFYCTYGHPLINGEAIRYPDGMDAPLMGDCRVLEYGWDREGRIVIRHNDSLPMTVLGVGGSIQWDDG